MNLDKCKFNADKLIYLGHKISARGIEPDDAKIKAIMEMSEPSDKKEIQNLLGLRLCGKVFTKTIKIYESIERVIAERCTMALGRTL